MFCCLEIMFMNKSSRILYHVNKSDDDNYLKDHILHPEAECRTERVAGVGR